MATTTATESTTPEVFAWLKNLPLAPEYHPTLSEFQDPISYIFKIEKEASRFGICKIVPPVQAPPKKTAIANLNRSLASSSFNSSPKSSRFSPTFTTRQQQIGFCPRRHHPVQKPVWKSGEYYTFHEFEAKAKSFEKNYLKRIRKKSLSALEMETLFWKACVDKPFSVEYANDMPGSAFVFPPEKGREFVEALDAVNVGETSWNMRGVSRSKGSLLRFMKEEIPGVTSPMLYIAMLFSWFAWHVEDHDLHSLNYLHMGAGKTWYGVPRDAAVAFEEVVRVHGYGGEINRLVTFAILGEKTTVMSPEVFLSAGIPCCRLVQNAGDFVVTFPKAYHCGFSHGFNCGEAANIATPEWLWFAKDAAIRRASIKYPLLVSHIQLLYDLALALCSSFSMSIGVEPRSSRLKDKKKGEGEALVKELFVKNVIQNNDLLHNLGKGSSIVLFPHNSPYISLRSRSHSTMKSRLSLDLCSPEEATNASKCSFSENQSKSLFPVKGISSLHGFRHRLPSYGSNSDDACIIDSQKKDAKGEFFCGQSYWLPENGMLSCVTCGILCFACCAIVQPKDTASRYLMSADCSFFNDWAVNSGVTRSEFSVAAEDVTDSQVNSCSDDGLYDVPILSGDYETPAVDKITVPAALKNEMHETTSALGLLASTYGNSSDSEEDQIEHEVPCAANETDSGNCSLESTSQSDHSRCSSPSSPSHHELRCEIIDPYWGRGGPTNANSRGRNLKTFAYSDDFEVDNPIHVESNSSDGMARDSITMSDIPSNFSPVSYADEKTKIGNAILSLSDANLRSGVDDSSRVHVFCLEHALEVEQLLGPIGGAHKLLVCNPEYPKVEAEARPLAEELGIVHLWNDNTFRDATKEDSEMIQIALDSEESVPGNGDWTVKLGVNLFYSAILSRSPLYSKQMPYNSVMYTAFGCSSPMKFKEKKGCGKQKKIVVAGKWCGKVWMSNQVHPLLAPRDQDDEHESKPERKALTSIFNAKGLKNNGTKRKMMCAENERTVKKSNRPQTELVSRTSPGGYNEQKQRDFRNNREKMKLVMDREEIVPSDLEGGPSTRLRKRIQRPTSKSYESKKNTIKKTAKDALLFKQKQKNVAKTREEEEEVDYRDDEEEEVEDFQCDVEGCNMGFRSKQELVLHKRNICPVKGCGKKFFSHKYLLQHRRVHVDDRPLRCPWRGCKMTFKWAWARTEHIRVHTGARPYVCNEPGCSQTFRFVSDFSRHKRKTGHSAKKKRSKR